MSHLLPRYCHASSSRNVLFSVTAPSVRVRRLSLLPQRHDLMPFFIPLHGPNGNNAIGVPGLGEGKGKGRMPPSKPNMEDEVDDREWEMRAARAMLHLRDTLPRFFDHDQSSAALFPPEIFSKDILLKLPQPLPLQISSLYAYTMAFAIARQGMQALHTDLYTNLDRMTFTPAPKDLVTSQTTAMLLSRRGIPSHRQKQIRVLVSVHARQRLLPNHEAVWKTSSLYTLSPVSGLISKHEVESIRPLPGEGVAEWLKNKLLGWTKQGDVQHEQGIPCPRAVRVPAESEMMRARRERMKE